MTTFLIVAALVAVGGFWAFTPFSLFGVDSRLAKVESAYRSHTEQVTAELRKLNELIEEHGSGMFNEAPAADRTLLVRNGASPRRG